MSLNLSLRHIRRSPYQTASAVLIMIITFFMVTVFLLIGFLSSAILKHFETKPQISAFYPNDTPETEILEIKKQLEESGLTKQVIYISPQEAVVRFQSDTQTDDIDTDLNIVSDKILPPSLEVTAWNISDLRSLKTIVEQKEGVNVVYVEEIINKLDSWLNGVRMGGVILLALLFIESILVVWTIIGMRISQRRHEIEIMRLLGATSWYIRAPFIVEGMVYGIVGSIIGSAITLGIVLVFIRYSSCTAHPRSVYRNYHKQRWTVSSRWCASLAYLTFVCNHVALSRNGNRYDNRRNWQLHRSRS
jgi:cell division transport system permease protein